MKETHIFDTLVSVIIPVYKTELYLKRCVDSVCNQTYKNLEIILVDDGSPDDCPTMCDRFKKVDSRIVVIHQDNKGLSGARNSGIHIAHGEYIAFVDSDDYVSPEYIQKMIEAARLYNVPLVMCNFLYVNPDGSYNNNGNPNIMEAGIFSRNEIWRKYYEEYGYYYVVSWNKLYCAKLWDEVVFPVGRIHEDQFVFHKILNQCDNIVVLNDKLVYYVQHKNSIMSSDKSIKEEIDRIESRIERFRFFESSSNKHEMNLRCEGTWIVESTIEIINTNILNNVDVSKKEFQEIIEKVKNISMNKVVLSNLGLANIIKIRLLYRFPQIYAKLLCLWKGHNR